MDAAAIRSLFTGVTSGYDTHRAVLGEAVLRTEGPILELGTGDGSTPTLHAVSTACRRRVFSFDHDAAWIARFQNLRTEHHLLAHLASWDDCPIESTFWSVALVDHAPAARRVVDIRRLAYRAELVVVHDTEDPQYGYDRVLGEFASRLDYCRHRQWTTLVSNYAEVSDWQIE